MIFEIYEKECSYFSEIQKKPSRNTHQAINNNNNDSDNNNNNNHEIYFHGGFPVKMVE